MEPTNAASEANASSTSLTFGDVLRFAFRYGPLAIILAIVGSCGASAWLEAGAADRYRATTTLVIQQSTLGGSEPELREFEAYRRMLESDAIVAETRRRLVERGVLGEKARLRPGSQLSVQTTTTRQILGRQFSGLVPVLDAVAVLDDPEAAAEAANVWAEVFLEELGRQLEPTQQAAVRAVSDALAGIETRIESVESAALERRGELEVERAAALAALDGRGEELHAAYLEAADTHEARTAELLDAARAEHATASLEARTAALAERLRAAATASPEARAPLARELDETTRELQAGLTALRTLEDARERGFHALAWRHEQAQLALEREREAVEQRAGAERKVVVEGLERGLGHLERVRTRLADELADATVRALRVAEQPVRVVAPAVAPDRPLPHRTGLKSFAFGIGLALAGLIGALAREMLRADDRAA